MNLIEPKEIDIDGRIFIISKFPATAGREIVTQYPITGMPKIGNYAENESLMLKLMCYVAIKNGNGYLRLSTRELVDNHTGSWETLGRVEMEMMEYNCSFFRDGRLSNFFESIAQKIPRWISKMLTRFSEQLSQAGKPRSTN